MGVTAYLTSFQRGSLAAASVGVNRAGTVTVLATTRQARTLWAENTTDQEVMITLGGADFKLMPAGSFRVLDPGTDGLVFAAVSTFGAYYTGSAPSTGVVEVVSLYGVVA